MVKWSESIVILVVQRGFGGSAAYIVTDDTYTDNRGFALDTNISTAAYSATGYSTEAWFKYNRPAATESYYGGIFGVATGTGGYDGHGFEIYAFAGADPANDEHQYYFYGNTWGSGFYQVNATNRWDVWQHVVLTVNADGTWKVYLNGVEVHSSAVGDAEFDQFLGFVGTDGALEMIDGRIDEVAFYGYTLSPSQVLDHYYTGIAVL